MNNILKRHYDSVTFFVVLIFYFSTAAKTLVTLDNGELAATSYYLGIPHPPGYPLFTMIGYLFSHLPIGMRVIEKLNLLSSIYTALSIYFVIKIYFLLFVQIQHIISERKIFRINTGISNFIIKTFSIIGGLIFAFSKTLWFQSTNYEVYSFQMFLIAGLIYFSFAAYLEDKHNLSPKISYKWIIAFIFFAGILSNHLLGLFFIIITFSLYLNNETSNKNFWFLVGLTIISILLSLIIYLYIPLRASQKALAGFGLPTNFIETIEHITGKIYRPFFFSSAEKFFDNLSFFFSSLWINFDSQNFNGSEFVLSIIFLPFGLLFTLLISRNLFILLGFLLLIYIILPASYGIFDIDAFFLYAYFILSIFITLGIFYVYRILLKKVYKVIFLLIIAFMILHQTYFNYIRVNQSKNFAPETYYRMIVEHLDHGSILFNKSSLIHSMSLYFQFVERIRPDVIVVLYPIISEKWYVNQIQNWYNLTDNILTIENGQVKLNTKNRPSYLTIEMIAEITKNNFKISGNSELAPYGLCFKLTSPGTYVEQKSELYEINLINERDVFGMDLNDITYQMMVYRINYELNYGQKAKAKKLLQLLKKKFPEQAIPENFIDLD